MKTFNIGIDRSLKLSKKNDEIIITDNVTKKTAVFTPARWASFRLCMDEVDNQLNKLSQGRGRGVLQSLWWWMAHVADEGFSLRRPPKILRSDRYVNMQTLQNRHRTTSTRMDKVQGGRRESASRQPTRHQLNPVLPQPGSHYSTGHHRVCRVQPVSFEHLLTCRRTRSVSFDYRVTVYAADDYDRKSPWMRVGHRIEQTELILALCRT